MEIELPAQYLFYIKFKDQNISDSQYNQAKLVSETFYLNNLDEYSNLYMKQIFGY